MFLSKGFDRAGKMLTGLKLCFASFLLFLCNGIASANLRHDGNKEDLMELLIQVFRKSVNTSTFSLTFASIPEI